MTRFGEAERKKMSSALSSYSKTSVALLGIAKAAHLTALVAQIVDSVRRVEYAKRLIHANLAQGRSDPANDIFDPLMAAVLQARAGNLDEAIWLVFLSTHFGKHVKDGWKLVRAVYFGDAGPWTFSRVANNPKAFENWLATQNASWQAVGSVLRFGNHRKYETLRTNSARGTHAVLRTYVQWIGPNRGHINFLADAQKEVGTNPAALFDYLYHSLDAVTSFGRTAKFDFLTMLGKLEFVPIEPGIPYLNGATGPLRGARLLFGGKVDANLAARDLEKKVVALGASVGFGMQVAEDALCNWQKSPDKYIPFRG